MTSSEPYAAVAEHLRSAAEDAAALWQQGAKALAEQAESWSALPTVDPSSGMRRYFELLTQAVDVNHAMATQWAQAVTSMTAALGQHTTSTPDASATLPAAVDDQAESAAKVVAETSPTAPVGGRSTPAAAAHRAAAKDAQEAARAPYLGLSKADLVSRLSDRKLPKSGTIEQLISRLVAADLGS